MDTITEWKKLFAKEGMDVYLGLQKAVKTLQSNTKRTSKEIVSQVKELGKKVEKKFQEQNTDPSEKESAISQFEQHLVEVLKNSYNVVVQAIQTYSESHGPKSKSKILKTYKKELKNAKKLIKEWTKKVEELKKDMKKKNKKDENKKDKKEDKKNKEHSENKKDADHKKDKKDSKKD